jgi:hypothetical protein
VIARLRNEVGQGLVSALILLAGVLLPLLFVVPLFARLEQGRLAAEQTARDAVRAAVEAPTPAAAEQAAETAAQRTCADTNQTLRVVLSGQLIRGDTLHADASAEVSLVQLPFFGSFGRITVHGEATAPVDQYRSVPGTGQ